MFKKLKQIFCNHDFNYYGKEDLFLYLVDGKNRFKVPTHTLICSNCGKQIIIRDMSKLDK
jgi:hypothetical protein